MQELNNCTNFYPISNANFLNNNFENQPIPSVIPTIQPNYNQTNDTVFGLQFAASQWSKLVTHAEDLFNQLVSSNQVSDEDKKQICEWLFLKQECEECISSEETISLDATIEEPVRSLGRIDEETETDEGSSVETTSSATGTESETETDIDYSKVNISEKLEYFITKFQNQTDQLVLRNYKDLLFYLPNSNSLNRTEEKGKNKNATENGFDKMKSRRKSIRPDQPEMFCGPNLPLFGHKKKLEDINASQDIYSNNSDLKHLQKISSNSKTDKKLKLIAGNVEIKQNKLRKLSTDVMGNQRQIDELQQTIEGKEKLIKDMIKNGDTRICVKQKFQKKHEKLREEYSKIKEQLTYMQKQLFLNKNAVKHHDKIDEIDRLKSLAIQYEKRIKDSGSIIKQISDENAKRVLLELQDSLNTSKKQVERLKKKLKKDEKLKTSLKKEIDDDVKKMNELKNKCNGETSQNKNRRHLILTSRKQNTVNNPVERNSSESSRADTSRVSDNLDERDLMIHEIRGLRKTRDFLVSERCSLESKVQSKFISDEDERKLVETEEAIDAIDAVIEYKNELLCGHKRFDTSASEASDSQCNAVVVKRDCATSVSDSVNLGLEPFYKTDSNKRPDKCQELLMQKLMKLSENEMRTILYKYFQKVVDLRDSGKKVEKQMTELEREYEASTWRITALRHALQQLRLEGEKRLIMLQRQHEEKLNQMLRYFTDETSATSSSSLDQLITYSNSKVAHKAIQSARQTTTCRAEKHVDRQLEKCRTHRKITSGQADRNNGDHVTSDDCSDLDDTTDLSTFDMSSKRIDHQITTFKHQNVSRKSAEERFISSKYCRQEQKDAATSNQGSNTHRITQHHEKHGLISRQELLTRFHHSERSQMQSHREVCPDGSTLTLNQLCSSTTVAQLTAGTVQVQSATKVTRQKNKLIIQQQGNKKK